MLAASTGTAHLVVGYPGTTRHHADKYALDVAAAALSGLGGRLSELRERGLVYQAEAFSMELLDPGYFAVYAATEPDSAATVLEVVDRHLRALGEAPLSAYELRRARQQRIGTFERSLQALDTEALSLAYDWCYGLGPLGHRAYVPAISKVSAGDVQRVARKHLAPGLRVSASVVPFGGEEQGGVGE